MKENVVSKVGWNRALAYNTGLVQVLATRLQIQLFVNVPGRAVADGSPTWFLPPMWEAPVVFCAPRFGLVQVQLLRPFGK